VGPSATSVSQWSYIGPPAYWLIFLKLAAVIFANHSPAQAEDSPELIQPLICSAFDPMHSALSDKCEITSIAGPGHVFGKKPKQVKIFLEAQSERIVVGGYRVTTENYGTYVPPVVEAGPGDTVAAQLTNSLQKPALPPPHSHGDQETNPVDSEENPTNLHYFHGGIVTPNNSRPMDARLGNGDNIYVYRKRGEAFDFSVPIPGELDARVLELDTMAPSRILRA
jgi:FtsP/CotA-like multicopper oxidase with cupredoxin domain